MIYEDVADALVRARALIAVRERWCQNREAFDVFDYPVEPDCADAVRWCGIGAIQHETPRLSQASVRSTAITFLNVVCTGHSFMQWQDKPWRTHKQVLVKFDRAIVRARSMIPAPELRA